MTRTLILSAIVALGTSGAALAGCKGHSQQAMSCAEGATWDAATQTCVPVVNS